MGRARKERAIKRETAPPRPPLPPEIVDAPDAKFDEAVTAWRRRQVLMPDPEFRDLDAAARERSVWVAGVTDARVLQDVFDAIDAAVRDGEDMDTFKERVGVQLEASWGGEQPGRLENVFRTNVMSAYNGGRAAIMRDMQDERPFVRYDVIEDGRTSPICKKLAGKVLPSDSDFVEHHHPPLHYQCRTILSLLDHEEAHAEGVHKGTPDLGDDTPTDGFGKIPTPDSSEPDLSGFAPELRKALKDRISGG